MAAERLSVRKIREVLRLHGLGLSRRDIGRSAGISRNTAGLYISRAEAAGLSPDAAAALDDGGLQARLLTVPPSSGTPRPVPDWSIVHREMRRKGVTLQLLCSEYKHSHPDGYQYTQYVTRYRAWESTLDPVAAAGTPGRGRPFVTSDNGGSECQRMPS